MSEEKTIIRTIHPYEVLVEDFMKPRGISEKQLAKYVGIDPKYVYQITLYRESITPLMAELFAKAFGTSVRFWLNLQAHYDSAMESMYKSRG